MRFYEYNQVTGRSARSNRLHPLYPLSATPLSKVEPPQVVYDTLVTQKSAQASTQANMSSGGVSKFPEVNKILADPKIQEKIRTKPAYKNYAAFLEKSYTYQARIRAGTPVYLIGGTRDKILFYIACGLTFACTMNSFKQLWDYNHRNK